MNIHFILVEPSVPENVGASARALKTMGFLSLRLVNPCDHLDDKAQMLAHGSVDILKNAKIYPNLPSALEGIDFVIGTTSKKRVLKGDYYSCEEILDLIHNKAGSVHNAAVVFGREDRGLVNDELQHCHVVSSVPMINYYPSLNLAQAVMIYAYSLSPLVLPNKTKSSPKRDQSQLKVLREKIALVLQNSNMDPSSSIYNRIMERTGALREGDIHLMHSVCNMLNRMS